MTTVEKRSRGAVASVIAVVALMGGGIDPSPPGSTSAPDQVPTNTQAPATKAPTTSAVPATATAKAAKTGPAGNGAAAKTDTQAAEPKTVPPTKDTTAKTEILPWANTPKVPAGQPAAAGAATSKSPDGKPAGATAAVSPCSGLFEAACRETTGCAWLAEITLDDGSMVAAHCVSRAPLTGKKTQTTKATDPAAAKKSAETIKPKPAEGAPAQAKGDAAQAPAPTATVTISEPGKVTITPPKPPLTPVVTNAGAASAPAADTAASSAAAPPAYGSALSGTSAVPAPETADKSEKAEKAEKPLPTSE